MYIIVIASANHNNDNNDNDDNENNNGNSSWQGGGEPRGSARQRRRCPQENLGPILTTIDFTKEAYVLMICVYHNVCLLLL